MPPLPQGVGPDIKGKAANLLTSFRNWDVQALTPIVSSVRGVIIKFLEQFGENRLHYANILG